MICPKCKAEYREGFAFCSDCHVDLVEKLPEGNDQNMNYDSEGFLIYRVDDGEEAFLIAAKNSIESGMYGSLLMAGCLNRKQRTNNINNRLMNQVKY